MQREVAIISEREGCILKLTLERSGEYSLRLWTEDGDRLEGLTLSEEELRRLGAAVNAVGLGKGWSTHKK